MSQASVLIARENEELRHRLQELAAGRGAGELCAMEAASAEANERDRRRTLVREALSSGLEPNEIGLCFVVAMAECAYELEWGEHFSFWPQISAILKADDWDPANIGTREQCTKAFRAFSKEFSALEPQGRFADCYTHVSWPLFHAVLPRAAQARMSKLLAKATADPRFVIAADGSIDDRELTSLLRGFATRSAMPAYFEGLLQHPTLGGRLGASLLSTPRAPVKPTLGLSHGLIDRVLRDLQEDRVAREQLEEAAEEVTRREERARRRQRAEEDKLELPTVTITLERIGDQVRPFLEVGPIAPAVREWGPLANAISHNEARITIRLNDVAVPVGYLVNVAYGAVSIQLEWPGGDSIDLSMEAGSSAGLGLADELTRYFERARHTMRLPLVFRRQGDKNRFTLGAPELGPGSDVAIVAPSRLLKGLDRLRTSLRMDRLAIPGRSDVQVLAGIVPTSTAELQELARTLGLRRGKDDAALWPVITPALRRDPESIEWLEGDDAFVQVRASDVASLRLLFESGGGIQQLTFKRAPREALIAAVPDVNGTLVLMSENVELARIRTSRRARMLYREFPARFRVVVMPLRPTRAELLGEACWLDVDALPGVHLKLVLSANEFREEATLTAETATLLQTAALLASMRRRIERRAGDTAALLMYELRVFNADEPATPALVQEFSVVDGPVAFAESNGQAIVRFDSDANPPTLSKLSFGPRGVDEYQQASVEPIVSGVTEGIYVARTGAAAAALAWASDGAGLPRHARLELPRRGIDRALRVVRLLRAVEAATLAPARNIGRASFVRRASVNSLERELVASMCGRVWLRAEEPCGAIAHGRAEAASALAEALGPLLWVPRTWLHSDFVSLADETSDPIEALERACHDGVGDLLADGDSKQARHLFLLFTRTSMASIDDDGECVRWANADVIRPRLVRLFYLAWPTGLERRIQALDEMQSSEVT